MRWVICCVMMMAGCDDGGSDPLADAGRLDAEVDSVLAECTVDTCAAAERCERLEAGWACVPTEPCRITADCPDGLACRRAFCVDLCADVECPTLETCAGDWLVESDRSCDPRSGACQRDWLVPLIYCDERGQVCAEDQCAAPTAPCAGEGLPCLPTTPDTETLRCAESDSAARLTCLARCVRNEDCSNGRACSQGVCLARECNGAPRSAEQCQHLAPNGGTCRRLANNVTRWCFPAGTQAIDAVCGADSECAPGLLCVQNRCRATCTPDGTDCDDGNPCMPYVDTGVCVSNCGGLNSAPDACAAGFKCQPTSVNQGVCRPGGEQPAGTPCATDAQCGARLVCAEGLCRAFCDAQNPQPCAAGETCWTDPNRFDTLGVCFATCDPAGVGDDCRLPGESTCFAAQGEGGLCYPSGEIEDGAPCRARAGQTGQCVPNSLCIATDRNSAVGACRRLCDPWGAPGGCGAGQICMANGVCMPVDEVSAPGERCAFRGEPCGDARTCLPLGNGQICAALCRIAAGDTDCEDDQRCAPATALLGDGFGYCR